MIDLILAYIDCEAELICQRLNGLLPAAKLAGIDRRHLASAQTLAQRLRPILPSCAQRRTELGRGARGPVVTFRMANKQDYGCQVRPVNHGAGDERYQGERGRRYRYASCPQLMIHRWSLSPGFGGFLFSRRLGLRFRPALVYGDQKRRATQGQAVHFVHNG